MKYLYLLLLTVVFIPISQVAYGQNIIDQIGQAFNNLTSGVMSGNDTNQSASSGSANQSASSGSANQSASSGSANQSGQGIGSFQELQTLTGGNQELLENNTSVAPENNTLGMGLEREQYVESENISNALSTGSNSSQ